MLKKLASSAMREAIYLLRTFVSKFPAQPIVVVYGFPDSEENSLVAASSLAGRARHPVYLLCSDVDRTRKHLELLVSGLPGAREIRLVCKSTLKAVWLSAFARVLLFTHGLFGNSAPGPFRLYINLWHGHGPKKAFSSSRQVRIPSDLIIANTDAYGAETARSLGLSSSSLVRIGNIRQDLMSEAPPGRVLQNLGLSKDRPYVVWMPTFREVYRGMLQSWVDAEALSSKQHLQEKMARFRKCIESSDLDFRVKLHPMDADNFEDFQEWQISTADLLEAGTTLYSFLGGASGMISDYSGVWVEYLALDRPLLLFCPDAGSYSTGRGFKNPNMMEIAAELITSEPAYVREFFQSIHAGEDWRPQARRRVRSILEPSSPGQIADRLVDVVNMAALRKGLDVGLSTQYRQTGERQVSRMRRF